MDSGSDLSRYTRFSRPEWKELRDSAPLTLKEEDLASLQGLNESLSPEEVTDVYLPLSRLLNLRVAATQALRGTTDAFLGKETSGAPYVIGVAGSVAVGKSTTARILRALLSRWPDHREVGLVTTDGFLLPNHELEARGLMNRKGFPQSYDLRRLIRLVADVKAGHPEVWAPVYSHLAYDVVPGQFQTVTRPDILIVEGLNVLQTGNGRRGDRMPLFVSDFFDFSIYVDADEAHIERWFLKRFLKLRDTVFQDEASYFHRYARLSAEEAEAVARGIWRDINGVNLRENILPTRERANLILNKGEDHRVVEVELRKL
ncbi:type I pantothenate kinase [Rubrobacter tropicus]|uniref:Pantothenate kinase n=1 Tax=Rubrobacter tropicus TaxID=2653851 RepID=A0A6G8Q406_9ACTN|nr:type I pantothenate kinase [Rubrobacter tropicus]QIN81195.1 type I pantothenate kinase [Rubrobacter tropicus]